MNIKLIIFLALLGYLSITSAMERVAPCVQDADDTAFESEVKKLLYGCERSGEALTWVSYLKFTYYVKRCKKLHPHVLNNRFRRYTPLIRAAQQHDFERCRILLEHGADINKATEAYTPISAAFEKYHSEYSYLKREEMVKMVKFLVDQKADINKPTSQGETPIMQAARRNSRDLCEALIQLGADPFICDERGNNALFYGLFGCQYHAIRPLCTAEKMVVNLLRGLISDGYRSFRSFLCCLKRIKNSKGIHEREKFYADALYQNRKTIWAAYISILPDAMNERLHDILDKRNNEGLTAYEYANKYSGLDGRRYDFWKLFNTKSQNLYKVWAERLLADAP